MLHRGLPVVADVIPADQIVVFTRNERLGRFTPLVAWPGDPSEDVSTLTGLPQLDQALRTDAVVLDEAFCVIPVGYCTDGELVMVVRALGVRPADRPGGRVRQPSCWPVPSSG